MVDRIFAKCLEAERSEIEREAMLLRGSLEDEEDDDFKFTSVVYVGEGNKVVMYLGSLFFLFYHNLVDKQTHVYGSSMGSMIASIHMAAFAATTDSSSREGLAGGDDTAVRLAWLKQLTRVCLATYFEAVINFYRATGRWFEEFIENMRISMPPIDDVCRYANGRLHIVTTRPFAMKA